MSIYSFRAECRDDMERLHEALDAANCDFSMNAYADKMFPDVEVELETPEPLEYVREVMRAVMDGHTMIQTLRACPRAENSFKRDYELR